LENVSSRTSSKNIKHLSKTSWSDIYNLSLKARNSNPSLAENSKLDSNNTDLIEKLKETEDAYQKVFKDYEDLKKEMESLKKTQDPSLQNQILLLQNKCSQYENEIIDINNNNKELTDQLKLSQKDLESQKEDFKHKADNYEKRIKNFEIIVNKYMDESDTTEKTVDRKGSSKIQHDKTINEKNEQISSLRQKCRELEDRVSKQNETIFKKNNELNDCKDELDQYKENEKRMIEDINTLKKKIDDLKQENIQLRYESYEKESTISTLQDRINSNEKDLKKAQNELLTTKNDLTNQLNMKEDLEKKCKTQSFNLEKEKDKSMSLLNQVETQKNRIASLEDKVSDLIAEREKNISDYEDKLKSRSIEDRNLSRSKDNEYKEKFLKSQSTIAYLKKEIEELSDELDEQKENYKKLYSNNKLFLSSVSNKDIDKDKIADDKLSVKSASFVHSNSANKYRLNKPLPNIKKENDDSKDNNSCEFFDALDKTSKMLDSFLENDEVTSLDTRSVKSGSSSVKDTKSNNDKKELNETELEIEKLNVQINKKRYELELLQRYIESLLYKIREKDEIIYDYENNQEEINKELEKDKELNKKYQVMIHQIESSRIEVLELNKELNSKINSLNDDLKKKEERYDSLIKKMNSLEKLNESILEQSEEKERELDDMKNKMNSKDRECKFMNDNLDNIKKAKVDEANKLKDIINDLKEQLETSKNYFNTEKEKLNKSIEQLKSDNEDLQHVCQEKKTLNTTLEKLRDNLVDKERESQDMKRSIDDLNNILYKTRTENDSLKNSLADLKTTLDNKDDELTNIKNSFKALSEKITMKENENEKLNSDLRSMDSTIIQNKSEREEMANTIKDLQMELNNCNDERDILQNKVNDMKGLLSKKEEEYNVILHLLQELKTNFSEKENENAQMKNSIQQLQHSVSDKENENAQMKSSLEKLQNSVTEKENENTQMKNSLEQLQNSVSQKESENAQMKNSLQQLQDSVKEKENENAKIKNSLQRLQNSMSEKDNEYSHIKNSLQLLKNSMTLKDKEVQETVNDLRDKLSQKEKEYQSLMDDFNKSKETISKLNEAQENSKSEIQEFRDTSNKYNNMVKENEDLIKELDFYTETMQKYNSRCKQLEAMNKDHLDNINKLKEENDQLKKQGTSDQLMIKQTLSDVQKEIENANQQIRNYREKEENLLKELEEERKICENLKKTKNDMEQVFKKFNADTTLEELISSIKDNEQKDTVDTNKENTPTKSDIASRELDVKDSKEDKATLESTTSLPKSDENKKNEESIIDNSSIPEENQKYDKDQYLTFKKKVKDITFIFEQKHKELSDLHKTICNNMKEFCEKNFIKELEYTTPENEVQHIAVDKYLNLPIDITDSTTPSSISLNNENENAEDEETKSSSSPFPSAFKNNIFTSNLSRIMKSSSLKEKNSPKATNSNDPHLSLVKKRVAEEYMTIIDALRESLSTIKLFLNYLKDGSNASIPEINTNQNTTSNNNSVNQKNLVEEFLENEDHESNDLVEENNDNESKENEDVDLLKRRLYYEIKNRWNIEEKLKSQCNLFVTFQRMLDCSIKQITENQNIIEELYTRLREANGKIKELEEENNKLKTKCQALEKKWYKQNIFNESFNGNVLANMDKRKRYSLPLTNTNFNPMEGKFSDNNPFHNTDISASSATLNVPESKSNNPFEISDLENGEDKVVLYKTNEFSMDMNDSDNDVESDESSNPKHQPTSFILNDEIFDKISHIKNEEDNYEKQIEDLIQKTVQYKLEIFENNYSYKN